MDTYIVRKNKQLDISTLLGVGESQTHGDKGCQARFVSWLLDPSCRGDLSQLPFLQMGGGVLRA